jgi:hypothetical protein
VADRRKRPAGKGKRGPPKGEGGAPRRHIDLDLVRRLAGIGCTLEEIAVGCDVAKDTLFRRGTLDPDMANAIDIGRYTGHTTLRRMQWHKAETGDTGMLIWLGKNLLGQRDRFPDEDGTERQPMRVVVELVGEPVPQQRLDAPRPRANLRLIDGDAVELDLKG